MSDSVMKQELPALEPFPNLHNPEACECDLVGLEDDCKIKPTLAGLIEQFGTLQQRERQPIASLTESAALRAARKL